MQQLMQQQTKDLDAKLDALAKSEIANARTVNKLEDEITSQLVTSTKDILKEGLSISELRFLQGQSNKRYGRRKQSIIRIGRQEIREGVRLSDDVIDKL